MNYVMQILTPERDINSSGAVTLVVLRQVGLVDESVVYWEVSSDGRLDLEPVSGNLTFPEVHTLQAIIIFV